MSHSANVFDRVRKLPPWEGYVVVNGDGYVLGVYGSALREMAEEQRKLICSQHSSAYIRVQPRTCDTRPSVGDILTLLR